MTDITIDAGTLQFSDTDLTATGLLVPYGVEARSNLGRFTVDAGKFRIPSDLTGASLNVEHQREHVVGAFTKAWEQPEAGIFAAFQFADTPAGRAAYQDAKAGKRKNLSAEVADVQIRDGRAVAGNLFAAALVERPAFAGATLLAAEDTEDPEVPAEVVDADPDQVAVATTAPNAPTIVTVTTPDGTTTTYTPEAEPAEDNPDQESTTMTATAAPARTPAVPATLLAGAPGATAPRRASLADTMAAFNRARFHQATSADMTLLASLSPRLAGDAASISATLFGALNNINIGGNSTGTANGQTVANITQPNWLGDIQAGRTYVRQYVPLGKVGNQIGIAGKVGFRTHRGTSGSEQSLAAAATAGIYAGAGAALASGKFFTDTVTSTLNRFAKGEAFDRMWFDLSGGEAFIAAALALLDEEVLMWTDQLALASWTAAAGSAVAPDTLSTYLPSDVASAYPSALARVVQGVVALKTPGTDGRSDVPTFAIVNTIAYKQLAYFGFVNELNKFSFSSTTDSSANIDGLDIVVGDIGIDDTPAALVGADYAVQFDELPGGPLHVDALELANGNADKAIHAYFQTFAARTEATILVGTADA